MVGVCVCCLFSFFLSLLLFVGVGWFTWVDRMKGGGHRRGESIVGREGEREGRDVLE